MKKYHYTYLIQHRTRDKRYIGVRSSDVHPTEDTSYWGSSKHLPNNIQEDHIKIILKIHPTREKAVEHEILLHKLNDVAKNPTYYNRARQTTKRFDTTGTVLSTQHKLKCSKALTGNTHTEETKKLLSEKLKGRVFTEETKKRMSDTHKKLASSPNYKNNRQGVTLSEDIKTKISKAIIEKGCNKGTKNNKFKPWFITYKNITHLFYEITKEQKSIEDGNHPMQYQRLFNRSKGTRQISKGPFKGYIIGNIPTYSNH